MPKGRRISKLNSNYTPPKCETCQQYLSVPPIAHISTGYHCGRCITLLDIENDLHCYRATAYECLAKTVLLPCQNDFLGCKDFLNFDEMKNHEEVCKFKGVKCPAIDCQEKILLSNVLCHYQKCHKDLMQNSDKIHILSIVTEYSNKLITLNTKTYILAVFIASQGKKVWLALRGIEVNPEETFYQLEIQMDNLNTLFLNQEPILRYNEKTNFNPDTMVNLDLSKIKSVLKGKGLSFSIRLSISTSNANKNNRLLEELECNICQEYMAAPIYNCRTGHSLCSNCHKKIKICSFCEAPFEGGRNFALEVLSENADLPCKNQPKGCSFSGSVEQIAKHNLECLLNVDVKNEFTE